MIVGVFCLIWAVYIGSGNYPSADSLWSVPLARSLIEQGNLNLDEYHPANDYRVKRVGEHYYSAFPIGALLMAVPVVWTYDTIQRWLPEKMIGGRPELATGRPKLADWQLEQLTASLIVAVTSGLIFLIGCQYLSRGYAIFLTLIFAFGTSAWSTASRALWQHGPSMLCLALVLYLLILARNKPWLVWLTGPVLAWAYVIRPTNSISLVIFTIYIALRYRRYLWAYLLAASLVLAPFLIFNFQTWGQILPPYYLAQRITASHYFWEALAGNLISPARGLLIYSPIILLSFWGVYLKFRGRKLELLDGALIAIIFLHWLAISSFPHWWGGYCFGPRFFSDVLPLLFYLMIPVFVVWSGQRGTSRFIVSLVIGCLVILSVFINWRGATVRATLLWNFQPASVDDHPGRLWDWSDPPWLR